VDGECIQCPNNQIMLIIGMLCLGIAMGAGAYYLNRKNISLALISIGVDFARASRRRRRRRRKQDSG